MHVHIQLAMGRRLAGVPCAGAHLSLRLCLSQKRSLAKPPPPPPTTTPPPAPVCRSTHDPYRASEYEVSVTIIEAKDLKDVAAYVVGWAGCGVCVGYSFALCCSLVEQSRRWPVAREAKAAHRAPSHARPSQCAFMSCLLSRIGVWVGRSRGWCAEGGEGPPSTHCLLFCRTDKQDPYAVVKIGSNTYRSRTQVDGGSVAKWDYAVRTHPRHTGIQGSRTQSHISRTHTRTHTHAHARTRTHTHARTHTLTHTRAHTHRALG
jgi:hypothetical protein